MYNVYYSWKIKRNCVRIYKGTAKVLWIIEMLEYNKANVKLSAPQLNKLKTDKA